jgi:hypothetical protein
LHQRIAVNKGFDLELINGYYKNIIAPKDGLYKLNYRWIMLNGYTTAPLPYVYVECDTYFKTHIIVNDVIIECELDIVTHRDHGKQVVDEYLIGGSAVDVVYSWQTKGAGFVWLKAGDKVRVGLEYDASTNAALSGAFSGASWDLSTTHWGEQDNGYIELHYIGNKAMKGIEYYV